MFSIIWKQKWYSKRILAIYYWRSSRICTKKLNILSLNDKLDEQEKEREIEKKKEKEKENKLKNSYNNLKRKRLKRPPDKTATNKVEIHEREEEWEEEVEDDE